MKVKKSKNNEISFLNPHFVVAEMNVVNGMSVADFGSGAGHFVLILAEHVGRAGKVYAVDLRKEVLEVLTGHIKLNGFAHIRTIKGDVEKQNGSTLQDESQDMVLLSSILHQTEHPLNVFQEARRVLKPSGRLVVVDWSERSKLGPARKISKKEAEKLASKTGFTKEKEIEAGNQHYGLIFKK